MRSLQEKPLSSKPVPPDDLWQQLDDELEKMGCLITPLNPPVGSFCLADFMQQRLVTRGRAQEQIRKLLSAGKIIRIGRIGNKTYYQLVKL
jgi:hypothetical protein